MYEGGFSPQLNLEMMGGDGAQEEAEQQTTFKKETIGAKLKLAGEAPENTTVPNSDLPESSRYISEKIMLGNMDYARQYGGTTG
jgi:hypothetical protein